MAITQMFICSCGAANHAIRLAVKGHTVFALDIHKPQLDYAQEKAEKAGAVVRFLWEDMCTFELPVHPAPSWFPAAVCSPTHL